MPKVGSMVKLPWRRGSDDDSEAEDDEAIVTCSFQDGSVSVREAELRIERPSSSRYETKSIRYGDVRDVDYSAGLVVSYLQIHEAGVEPAEGSTFSPPVDENTLHFGGGGRDCAQRIRDEVLERIDAAR